MADFFTADTHFSHGNIIKYCNRPFESVKEMNDELIRRWNRKVSKNDTVYHLGDFAFHMKYPEMLELLKTLNGKKVLIKGNHDHKDTIRLPWEHKCEIADVTVAGKHLVLCHYPLQDWNRKHHGALHLHGHCHGNLKPACDRFDIGVDSCGDYEPNSGDEVLEMFDELTRKVING